VVVNCGAIPANLIQSELFGYEKGAFTGAVQRKIGSIEAANGGHLFLDEVGDLPMSQQVNLLRVLQERSITRIGSTEVIPVDFRIIAASHVDLQVAIRDGRFREDLYYRLNVVHMNLPALRHRHDDVRLLAESIFKKYATANKNCRAKGFSTEAIRSMKAYHWPGNVRELMNRIHRAVILSDHKLITAADLGLEDLAEAQSATLEKARSSLDRTVVEDSLRANNNNVTRAARQLGVSRVTFYRMMSKHNIAVAH
jgi:transcriptional regulator with PAS, ATPase and Fis domain